MLRKVSMSSRPMGTRCKGRQISLPALLHQAKHKEPTGTGSSAKSNLEILYVSCQKKATINLDLQIWKSIKDFRHLMYCAYLADAYFAQGEYELKAYGNKMLRAVLAGKVANMSATCWPDSQMSAFLANIPLSWQHKTNPDTVFLCRGLLTFTQFVF